MPAGSRPALRHTPVTPAMVGGGNISATTSATGANWVAFDAQSLSQLTIVNDTGTDIEWRQDSAGVALPIASGNDFTIYGISDASQISVRRVDQSNTQKTVKARWEI